MSVGTRSRTERLLVIHPRGGAARPLLAAYGVAFAVFASIYLIHVLPNQETLMGTRVDGIAASIAVVDRGGPPLLGSKRPYGAPGVVPRRDYYPVGITDDQGLYLYLPLLAKLSGQRNPHVLLKWFFVGAFGLLFAVYPLLFYELMGSVLAGVLAPLIVFRFDFLRNTDLYWIGGWCVLLCVPMVLLAWRRVWNRWSIALLLAATILGSFATSIRIHSGLPILLAALMVVFLKERSWRRRVLVWLALVLASFTFSVGVLSVARIVRDDTVGIDFRKSYPSQHPFWHNAYIGLGYYPNKYGITWNDAVSIAAVQKVDPKAGYLTPKYESILRHLYWKLFRRDPGFVLGTLWTKLGVSLNDAVQRFGWLLLLLPVAVIFGSRRRDFRVFAFLTIPALVLTLLPPVITVPHPPYLAAWLASVGLLGVLVITWLAAELSAALGQAVEMRARGHGWFQRSEWAHMFPSRRELVVAGAIALLVAIVLAAAIYHERTKLNGVQTSIGSAPSEVLRR